MIRVVLACAITLATDLIITEAWLDIRPAVVGTAAHKFLDRCAMEDGHDTDYALMWKGHKRLCINLQNGEIRS